MPSLKLSNPFRRGDGRPSLKQRAAALKASAARVLKRPERAVASSSNARAVYVDPIGEDGLMTYLDAAGNQHRQPVGHWIAFMSQRMYSIARRDYDRRFRDYPSERLDGDGWIRLDAQLRRELSLDALKVLAFKPLSVFDAVEAEAAPVDSDERRPDAALIALCNEAAREERTAQIKCNTDPDPAPGEEEPDYWGRSGDLLAEATAAKPATVLGLAAKAKVVLAHAPEALELGAQPLVYELALALVRDVVRIGQGKDVATSLPASDDLVALAQRFDDAHTAWLAACEAHREPAERHSAYIEAAKKRGGPTMEDLRAAEALPGVSETWSAEDRAFGIVGDLALEILRLPARSVADLAIQARAVIPHVWPTGGYEESAGSDEDSDDEAVRLLIESCCTAAGVDWRGGNMPPIASPDDPIHALIAEHRATLNAFDALPDLEGEERSAEFWAKRKGIEGRMLTVTPTTGAGLRALVAYLRENAERMGEDISKDQTERDFLLHVLLNAAGTFSTLDAPAVGDVTPSDTPEAQTDPDPIHAAIAASREAQAAYETWERGARGRMTKAKFAEEDRLVAEQTRTREAAFATVPTTRAGQLALLEYARDYLRLQLGIRSQSDDADVDVEALVWRTAYRALEACLRAGVPTEQMSPPAVSPDLSSLTVQQLWHLSEAYRESFMWWGRIGSAPWAWDGRRENYSGAGRVTEAEYDRHLEQWSAVHGEARRREPASGNERDKLLEMRLVHEMECNGRIHDPALLADLSKAWGA